MQFKNHSLILCTVLLLATTQVCRGQKPLMCYVCDNCAKVSDSTPLLECNADYFSAGGTTLPATMTTTTNDPTTMDSSTTVPTTEQSTTQSTTTDATTISSSTTEAPTTTSESTSTTDVTSSTKEDSTTDTTVTQTTQTTIPTPKTVVPPLPTTAMPTPPNSGTTPSYDNEEVVLLSEGKVSDLVKNVTASSNMSDAISAAMGAHVRSVRAAVLATTDYTYHCYSVQKKNDTNTWITERGCSRVTTMQSVCGQVETTNSNIAVKRCSSCSMPRCNSGTALHVSVLSLIVAAVAVFLHYN